MSFNKLSALKKYLIICLISLLLFSFLFNYSLLGHRYRVIISFFLVPVLILIFTKERLNLGKINKFFFLSIFIYFVFFLWIIVYYPSNKDFFSGFNFTNKSISFIIFWNITIFLHVSTIDFFTKRIVQFKATQVFGEIKGLEIQVVVWMIAHIKEFFWLNDLMENLGCLIFLFVSGIITGIIYMKTRDIIGLMVGHWLLNFLVMIMITFKN